VEVIVMGLPDGTSGFLPFERTGPRTGGPLGIKLADFQGLVAAPGASWSVAEVLSGARLDCLAFDHLVLDGSPLEAHVLVQEPSPVVDLGSGFEAYLADLRAAGSVLLPQVERKHRALVRKSHVEFCWRDDSTQAFAELVNWKQAQRRESHSIDVLGWAGVVELLNELRAVRRDGFEGVLSTLRIDGQYAAVHFGLRAGPVVHWWFTGYSPAFRRHSPGLLLLLLAAEAAARDGVQRIDLGKGDDAYKASFANRWTQVGVGAADTFVLRRWARRGWSRLRRWVKDSPLRGSARRTKQLWRRWQSLTAPR
jgi:CelD/BcsL family acetyltransferase involved in cellulose biosynthesis